MNIEEMSIDEILSKEFYIVDCEDYIYFPRKIRIIGIEISSEDGERYITDIEEGLPKENRKMYAEELNKFKNIEQAYNEANRLNQLPENKKRAYEWNNPESVFKRKYMRAITKG